MIECPFKTAFYCKATERLIIEGRCIACRNNDQKPPKSKTPQEVLASLENYQEILASVNPVYGRSFHEIIEWIKKEVCA